MFARNLILMCNGTSLRVGFIGAGKMATAIAAGMANSTPTAGAETASTTATPAQSSPASTGAAVAARRYTTEIFAADISAQALKEFQEKSGATICKDNHQVIANSDIVVLAVKPQMFEKVLGNLQIPKDKLVVSIAGGIKMKSISEWLSGHEKIVRVMPNTPLMVGMGASAYCCTDGVTASEQEQVVDCFSCAGIVKSVDENDMDAVTGVSGSGPAYVFEFIESLAQGGVENGLSYQTSLDLAVQTVAGAAQMVSEKQGTPEELRNAVTSPNGTTYAALQDLKSNDFRDIVISAVSACNDRSVELSQGATQPPTTPEPTQTISPIQLAQDVVREAELKQLQSMVAELQDAEVEQYSPVVEESANAECFSSAEKEKLVETWSSNAHFPEHVSLSGAADSRSRMFSW